MYCDALLLGSWFAECFSWSCPRILAGLFVKHEATPGGPYSNMIYEFYLPLFFSVCAWPLWKFPTPAERFSFWTCSELWPMVCE